VPNITNLTAGGSSSSSSARRRRSPEGAGAPFAGKVGPTPIGFRPAQAPGHWEVYLGRYVQGPLHGRWFIPSLDERDAQEEGFALEWVARSLIDRAHPSHMQPGLKDAVSRAWQTMEQPMVCAEVLAAEDTCEVLVQEAHEGEMCIVLTSDGYQGWLEKFTSGGSTGRLSWKERKLGKEVPKHAQGTFFDGAKDAELDKWRDTKSYVAVRWTSACRNVISCRYVCRWKPTKPGDALTHKASARLCVHGFKDCDWWAERASPTARRTSRRVLQHVSVQRGWPVNSVDAERAFLQTKELSREVHVIPPKEAKAPEGIIWRLLKPVYGLVDAPKAFF